MEQVPVVDFAPFLSGSSADKQTVADAIGAACEGIGFFYLTNHGISPETIRGIFDAARRFFDVPLEQRMDPALLISPEHSRGYQPVGARLYPDTAAPDVMEAFKYQRELPLDDPDILAGDRIQQSNKWPRGLPGWRETLLGYFEAVDGVAANLLRTFALTLDVEEDYFLGFYEKPLTQVSLLHYPPAPPTDGLYGNRPHADATAFTIVLQGDVPGLEVQTPSGRWATVPPIEGSFVINIGDYMARWTNDRFRSTKHRVVNRTGQERFSVPYFAIPDYDAVVECVPTCQGPGDPPKYDPLHVGRSIQQKFSGDYV
ncbi:MAG: isopenicillin N synthase family oxygenase [Alphaproteobacteria bacterium]|nr:isopenicillin N synthase family oxygenase [Alphaproteobacteria bacterium]